MVRATEKHNKKENRQEGGFLVEWIKNMFEFLKKGISTSVAIGIILVLAIFVGGVTSWQYQEMQKEELGGVEISVPEKEEVPVAEEIPKEQVPESTPNVPVVNKTTRGRILQDEIWRGEIHIIGDIIVEEGFTLTIEPGTRVLVAANQDVENLFDWPFDMQQGIRQEHPDEDPYYRGVHFGEPFRDEGNHISILVHGTLHAVGTPERMITITSDGSTPGIYDWNFFQFDHGIFSYCIMEHYRGLNPGNDTVVSRNILRHVGECAVCANSSVVVENNMIYDAGHELVDMHNASPTIRNNTIGPNTNRCGIVIDGGSPLIAGNTIKDCGSGVLLLVPPENPSLKDNIIKNNTFLDNGQNVSYGY